MKTGFYRSCALLLLFSGSCTTAKKVTPAEEIKKESAARPRTDSLLSGLLARYPQYFDSLLQNNTQWQIKIIYTQIDRNEKNEPQLTHTYYNIDPDQYFYPASTVKMPAAALALQKLNELNIAGLDKYSTMITDAEAPGQTGVYNDPSAPDGRPSVAHYINKIFLVSDNDAYNRLYEFLGQEYLNNSLHKMGYDSVQLLHRLQLSLSEEANRTTNPIRFFDTAGRLLYAQPGRQSKLQFQSRNTLLGKGYINGGRVFNSPFDFSKKNRFSLPDLHTVLQSLIFPETVPEKKRFALTADDFRFLYRSMAMLPRESDIPPYTTGYADGYVKFLLFGGGGQIANPALRIFNKVGDAYGFLQDVAYVADFEKGIEFMLSASIYCNSDGIFNDDKYDYETVGFPFLRHLGQVVYEYETKRPRKHIPDLSKFRIHENRQ